jgi:hypothetical protein
MFPHATRRVILAARWVLLSCGCSVTLHGTAPVPTYCPDCRRSVTASGR